MNRFLFSVAVLGLFVALPASAAMQTPQLAVNSFPIAVPASVASIITEAAAKYDVNPNLIAAMAFKESRFNSIAVSRRGAQGILQLMPRTAKALGVIDSLDVRQNIFGGTKYIAQLLKRFNGNVEMALAAYNAGPERVAKEGPRATSEAIDYVAVITNLYRNAIAAM